MVALSIRRGFSATTGHPEQMNKMRAHQHPQQHPRTSKLTARMLCIGLIALLPTGCATMSTDAPLLPDTIFAVTAGNALIRFNAGRPQQIDASRSLTGLEPEEKVLGIDFRPANSRLYAAGSSGRLYVIDTNTGVAIAVDGSDFSGLASGDQIGFVFNPVSDQIHLTDAAGHNLRLHPDTGRLIDGNPMLAGVQPDARVAYAVEDRNAGRISRVAGIAYTNGHGHAGTTSFAIDSAQATLVTLGRPEGTTPAKAPSPPHEGRLFTIGRLEADTGTHVGFDIHPVRGSAYASFRQGEHSVLYKINLANGEARRIGPIGSGTAVLGISIAP